MPKHPGTPSRQNRRAGRIIRLAHRRDRSRIHDERDHIEILGRDVLRQRSIDTFPNAYATLLSIVLGIALGTLAVTLVPSIPTREGLALVTLLGEAGLSAIGLIVVFYNYVWFMLIFRWAPGVLDTLIPFALGSCVVAVAATVGNDQAWLIAFSILHVFGAAGYGHTLYRASPNMFQNRVTYQRARGLLVFLFWVALAGTPLGVIAAWNHPSWQPWSVLGFGFFVLLAAIAMISISEWTLSRIYKDVSLVRLPLFTSNS